jgi:protein gp37
VSGATHIEWTDATWNPVRGCTRVSEGCRHCYAERQAVRHARPGGAYEGLAKTTAAGPRWTGVVRFVPEVLDWPLRWGGAAAAKVEGRPSRIFVNSMSDLFHEGLSFEQIGATFGVMMAAAMVREHTFQVLTKRPQRVLEFAGWLAGRGGLGRWIRSILGTEEGRSLGALFDSVIRTEKDPRSGKTWRSIDDPWMQVINAAAVDSGTVFPCNVWLGVSAEDQATADERIRLLLQCPAAVRFVSYEPALGPVDFERGGWSFLGPLYPPPGNRGGWKRGLDWVIFGGESGPGARPVELSWARNTVAQCRAAGVACFVKQLGAKPADRVLFNERRQYMGGVILEPFRHSKGGDWSEWPEDLRVREFPA